MKTLLVVSLLFCSFVWSACAAERGQELSPTEATAYLEKLTGARKQHGAFQVDFQETRRSLLMREPVLSSGVLSVHPDGRFRLEVPGKSIMVNDGEFLWIYYPVFSEVEKYSLSAAGPAAETVAGMTSGLTLQGLQKQFRVQVFTRGDEKTLILIPKSSRLRRVMRELVIAIGPDDQAQKIEWTSAKDEVTTLELSGERPVAQDSEFFQFRPMEGTRVVSPLGS